MLFTHSRKTQVRVENARRGLRRAWQQHRRTVTLAGTMLLLFTAEAMAQEARVRGFFTRARDLLIFIGPAVTIGSIFWGGANVLRERPAGKQWTAAAIFLALTILSGVLQDWWQ